MNDVTLLVHRRISTAAGWRCLARLGSWGAGLAMGPKEFGARSGCAAATVAEELDSPARFAMAGREAS